MEVLILLVAIGVVWQISSRRWRRCMIQPLAIATLVWVFVTSPVMVTLATQGLIGSLPVDSGEPADAIVILGRGETLRTRRVELAEQLWREKRAAKIFVSGMSDAREMIQGLKTSEIPQSVLSGEKCSQTTEENAQFTSAILYSKGVRKILLITDAPHMLRSLRLFSSFGFTVLPYPSPLPPQWSSGEQLLLILREYLGMAQYSLQGRFKQRTVDELEHPPAEVLNKLSEWHCWIQAASANTH